jgi:hypothetical protein
VSQFLVHLLTLSFSNNTYYNILEEMEERDVNNLEPVEVEEYENEDSFGNSNNVTAADPKKIGDPIVDSASNEVVNQEDPSDAYQKKKKRV